MPSRKFSVSVLLCLTILVVMFAKEINSRVCRGTSNRMSTSVSVDESHFHKEYGNCTVINNNVEISNFKGIFSDLTFLDLIEEVKGYILIVNTNLENFTMKSLKLVRGNELFHNNGIFIRGNLNLKRIEFPSLKDIVKGNILIETNPLLCFVDTIKWNDTLYEIHSNSVDLRNISTSCPKCKSECSGSCWSEDQCQEIWKLSCLRKFEGCPTGCVEDKPMCCNVECVLGCVGKPGNCTSCRNFNNSGTCVNKCPSPMIYDPIKGIKIPNPNGSYMLDSNCVQSCHGSTVQYEDSCLAKCPENHYKFQNTCKECPKGNVCPKTCDVNESLDGNSIQQLVNCSIIHGHLLLLNHSFHEKPSVIQHLELLSSVTEITGFLVIQFMPSGIDDLSFLRNLKVIKGQRRLRTTFSALFVHGTGLKSLNLTSLERIEDDKLHIIGNKNLESLNLPHLKYIHGNDTTATFVKANPMLCYIDENTFVNISDPSKKTIVSSNREKHQCEKDGRVCHSECFGGCWGPGPGQCRFCHNLNFKGECVSSCDAYPSLYRDGDECKTCDPQCLGECNGEGPKNCSKCQNAMDDFECVERCPVSKHKDQDSGQCQSCHSFCKNGCSGPFPKLGEAGCNDCELLSSSNECVNSSKCEDKFYMDLKNMSVHDALGKEVGNYVHTCQKCDGLCKTCEGGGTRLGICECLYVKYGDYCIKECPSQNYKDSNNTCQLCHPECDGCYGPNSSTCEFCRNFRIILTVNDTNNDTNGYEDMYDQVSSQERERFVRNADDDDDELFICEKSCPSSKPYAVDIQLKNGKQQRVCHEAPDIDHVAASREKSAKALTGSLVLGGFLLICVAAVVIAVLRRQKAKADENKAKLQAQIDGLDTDEIIAPSCARPDLSSLRLIKESELDKGSKIGSGAFGTVYRGIWHPEGEKVRVAVAIKVLAEGSTSTQHQELLEEARVMASVIHPCCIRILAVCLTRQMMLITPLVVHGSLLDYIHKNGPTLGSHVMLKWATQIARGMAYLEQIGIVHRDLAARNILVQGLKQVKITDFGLAKLLNYDEEEYLSTGGKLPIKWLALESIQHRIFTHKSDVWSYGVTLWELFTYGQRPYESINALNIAEHLEIGERLSQPIICTIDVYVVMIKCWMVDSESRPSFQELEVIFGDMTRDPGRYLVITGDRFMRMPSDIIEDNRLEVIRQMNLTDEEDLICGEDYLCPATPTRKLTSVMEEETCFVNSEFLHGPDDDYLKVKSTGKFTYLEAALRDDRMKQSDHYLSEPGNCNQLPRPPSLDETEILKLEQSVKSCTDIKGEEKEDYLEPVAKPKAVLQYLEMKSPGVGIEANLHGPTPQNTTNHNTEDVPKPKFGQRSVFGLQGRSQGNDYENDNKGNVTAISYSKTNP